MLDCKRINYNLRELNGLRNPFLGRLKATFLAMICVKAFLETQVIGNACTLITRRTHSNHLPLPFPSKEKPVLRFTMAWFSSNFYWSKDVEWHMVSVASLTGLLLKQLYIYPKIPAFEETSLLECTCSYPMQKSCSKMSSLQTIMNATANETPFWRGPASSSVRELASDSVFKIKYSRHKESKT